MLNVPDLLTYLTNHSGPFTIPGTCEAVAWVKTKYANQSDDWPDVQYHLMSRHSLIRCRSLGST